VLNLFMLNALVPLSQESSPLRIFAFGSPRPGGGSDFPPLFSVISRQLLSHSFLECYNIMLIEDVSFRRLDRFH